MFQTSRSKACFALVQLKALHCLACFGQLVKAVLPSSYQIARRKVWMNGSRGILTMSSMHAVPCTVLDLRIWDFATLGSSD